jgi:hypothetical protein
VKKPQLMWACVGRLSGSIWSVHRHRLTAERAVLLSLEDVRRVEVRVVARKRKRRKP